MEGLLNQPTLQVKKLKLRGAKPPGRVPTHPGWEVLELAEATRTVERGLPFQAMVLLDQARPQGRGEVAKP